MSEAAEGAAPPRPAWQPFTFGGLAAFAQARLGRLLLAELVTAMLVSASVVAFLHADYSPVIVQAIQKMPETARVVRGRLVGIDTTIISETKLLALAVTPDTFDPIGQSADVQVQFRFTNFRVGTVFRPDWGMEFDYGLFANLDLSRSHLEPWWGAWHPIFLVVAGIAVVVSLFVMWAGVALIYTVPAICLSWIADRELTWGGAWRLSSAAMLPGALLVVLGIFLYGSQMMDLVGLAFVYVAHLLMGWVYVAGGVWACPRLNVKGAKPNPFLS